MDIQDIAKKFALIGLPLLGAALPIPGGMALGTALAASLGCPNGTPEELLSHLTANPEQIEKAREFELENRKEILLATMTHELDTYRAEASDRDSARKRDVESTDGTNRTLAYIIIGAFIAMAGATLMGWAKADSVMAGTVIGYLSAKAEQVIAFYFGSTFGSQRKTELLSQAQPIGVK